MADHGEPIELHHPRQVGALELTGARPDMGCEIDDLILNYVSYDEQLEASEGGYGALGVGEGRDRITARHEKGAHVAGLDLVDQPRAGVLTVSSRQLRTTGWSRLGKPLAVRPFRNPIEAGHEARIEPRAALPLEGARHDL